MKSHQITVPVIFWCDALSASRRTKRECLNGYIPLTIEIAEFDPAEAPIACRYPESYRPETMTPVRYVNGRFFEPVYEGNHGQGTLEYVKAETFIANAASGFNVANPLARSGPVSEYLRGELSAFNSEAFKDYDKAAAQKCTGEVLETAKGLVLIDDLLWREVPQPVYKIVSPMHHERQRYGAWVKVEHLQESLPKRDIIPLSSWSEAVDVIKARFGDKLSDGCQAEVFLPEVFDFDFTSILVLEDLFKARNAHRTTIGDADIETMLAWGNFRDAVDRAVQTSEDALIDEAIDRYGKEYGACPQPDKDGLYHLNVAQDRWNMRVIAPSPAR